ncbi:MAG: S41 family peptidase [Pyrinomonadaceae bacterium]|nr:S41 family peptidase [Pyrinomonadaceae bacterium]
MKKNFSLPLSALLVLALSLPAFVIAQNQKGEPSGPIGSASSRDARSGGAGARATGTGAIEQDFTEALTIVQENYVDGGKLDHNTVFKSSIIGMLRALDPHSNYYDRQEFEELRTDQRSEYHGIGASINNWRLNADQVDTYIMATFDGSPAARAGLRYGDRIISVDGQAMTGKSSAEVRDKIRGPRGTTVKVTVERASNGRAETVEITRDAVAQPSVPDYYMLRPGVGYVDMTRGFNYETAAELERAIEVLRERGMTSLVLDLRGNPGGFLDQAVKVADEFLSRGQVILTQKGRTRGGERTYKSSNSQPNTTPLVVLINGGSASASEIVAGALQDHDRALIVGENSFGKGLVQSIIPLEYGAGLTLTSAKYYTPSGRLIQRDYSNGSLYDYYTRGADNNNRNNQAQPSTAPARTNGTESRTDMGRVVYGGGGIMPDEAVKPRTLPQQQGLLDSIIGFTRELISGRINGFDSYKVQRPIDFDHELQATDFPFTEQLLAAYKRYAASKPSFKVTEAQIDRNRDFIRWYLRYQVVMAAYGSVAAERVRVVDDPQATKAVEVLPRARDLALAAARGRNPQQRSFE